MKIQNTITKKVYDINTTILGDVMDLDTSLYSCSIEGIDYQTADQGAIDWWLEYAPRYQELWGLVEEHGLQYEIHPEIQGVEFNELNGVIEAFLDDKGIEN